MSIYRSSEAKSNILSLVMMIIIWVPYIFGLGFSFYRFGNNDGILSIVIPPYAWYRGISYLWVEPKGKEEWEYHTALMASLIASAPMENPLTDMERQRKLLSVQKWISGLPEQKRNALLNKATALGSAIEAYLQETFINLRNNGVLDAGYTDKDSINQHVDIFRNEPGIMAVWNILDKQQQDFLAAMKPSDLDPELVRERVEENIETLEQMEILSKAQTDSCIKLLFGL